MNTILKYGQKKKLQDIFWIRVTFNYYIKQMNDFLLLNSHIPCDFVRIHAENCYRVQDFRDRDRVSQYQEKLARNEIGYFAEHNEKMVGSIWATINTSAVPEIVRTYMKLMPGDALIHDIVTGERSRGNGIGPFMTSHMAEVLLREYKATRIVIDVNTRNHPSNRMMEKLGLRKVEKMLYVSLMRTQLFRLLLKSYV